MFYEYLSVLFGIIKIFIYKLLYFKRIKFLSIPKMNKSFHLIIRKNSNVILGKNFRARNNVAIRVQNKGEIHIGNNVFFNDNCSIVCHDKINIGNNVIFGQNVMLFDHDHDYKNNINNYICKEIKIGNNVWIGANCTILKGVSIGNNVVVAAGTVVNQNIDDNVIVYQKKETIIKKR